jgi:hypothetical protein
MRRAWSPSGQPRGLRVVPDVSAAMDVAEVLAEIDAGEAAAIAVAIDRHADLLLIDDAAGRRPARRGVPRVRSRRRAGPSGVGRGSGPPRLNPSHRFVTMTPQARRRGQPR